MLFKQFASLSTIAFAAAQAFTLQAAPCDSCGVVNLNVAHTGNPTGEMVEANGVKMYVAYPPDKKTENAILYLSDVFGLSLVQNKLLADSFAKAGYLVVEPDYFEGDALPVDMINPSFNWAGFLAKHSTEKIDSVIERTIKHMRSTMGVKRIGAVGYCFGGKYIGRFLAEGKGVNAGFAAHPTMLDAGDLRKITGPLSIAAAETDPAFPPQQRHETEGILQKRGLPYQLSLYGGVSHGFGVRANITDKREKYAKEEAYLQAVRFFDTWIKQ